MLHYIQQVRVDNKTIIEKSKRKYETKEEDDKLKQLCDIPSFTKINYEGKVVQVDEATKAANKKTLQNVLIAGRTATVRVRRMTSINW